MIREKKAKIAAELNKVMPEGWKYTLGVKRASTIVLVIESAPVDLIALNLRKAENKGACLQLDEYRLHNEYAADLLPTFEAINAALNLDNLDAQRGYFHIGHYVAIYIGRWNKPFVLRDESRP